PVYRPEAADSLVSATDRVLAFQVASRLGYAAAAPPWLSCITTMRPRAYTMHRPCFLNSARVRLCVLGIGTPLLSSGVGESGSRLFGDGSGLWLHRRAGGRG